MDDEPPELGARDLIEFLDVIEEHLDQKVTLVAAGGTALTLLDAKPSTIDIDFTGPADSIHAFGKAESTEPHGYDIDRWPGGTVFMVTLPDDYLDRSRAVETTLQRIELRALHPVDVVVTKIARLDGRDKDDIRTVEEQFNVTTDQVEQRASEITYVGAREGYEANLRAAIRECLT